MENNLVYNDVKFDNINLKSSTLSPNIENKKTLFMFHGGGIQATMDRFLPLRVELCKLNIETISFDFIGHGLTGGNLYDTSLFSRTQQALTIIKYFKRSKFSILGTSMGAFTALKLTEQIKVENLILSVPAVYSREAYQVLFGDIFRTILKQNTSWLNSEIWQLCEIFTGKVLLITAMKDEVVPKEIITKLLEHFISSQGVFRLEYNCSHQILAHLNSSHSELTKLSQYINYL